jgi:hypothetical protein
LKVQRLMSSVAAAAFFAVPGFADTELSSDSSTPLTTGALLSEGEGTANAGNITINDGITLSLEKEYMGAVTIDSSHYLLNIGTIENKDTSYAYGIHIDVSTNPNLSGASFVNAASGTINGSGLYFDSGSSLLLTDDGTGKYGLFFDSANGSGTYTGNVIFNTASVTLEGSSSYGIYLTDGTTFKGDMTFGAGSSLALTGSSDLGIYIADGARFEGDLTFESTSSLSIVGDTSQGIYIASGGVLAGNLSFGGDLALSQATATTTSSTGIYGMLLQGEIDGNLSVDASGSVTVYGADATGISVQGSGVTGSIDIGGTLSAIGYSSTVSTTTTTTISTYPEAGSALAVGASVTHGIAILGPGYYGDSSVSSASVMMEGTSAAVAINPGFNSAVTQTAPLTIGIYSLNGDDDTYDPGFSFYNRGTISAAPVNTNAGTTAFYAVGSSAFPTILSGGLFNSGTISATTYTSGTTAAVGSATALNIGSYTILDNATFDSATAAWNDTVLAGKSSSDQAALVNSSVSGGGVISANVSGSQAGTASALYIAQYASVPTLINSGSITAAATTTDKTLTSVISSSNTYTLQAIAIRDASGSLTSIINTGMICAVTGGTCYSPSKTLDSQNEVAIAIDLSSGNIATPSGSGVLIKERASATSSALITGDIYFGTGDNQVIDVAGTSSTYTASITGDIAYGNTGSNAVADQLNIGAYGIVTGKLTAGSGPGVIVDVAANGVLALQNDKKSFNTASVHVAGSGSLSLAVSRSLTNTGVIDSQGAVTLDKNANLYLSYSSFVPQGSNDFVLITTPYGQLHVDPATIAVTNTFLTKNVTDNGTLPYLFKTASLEQTSEATTGDSLVLHVVPKTASQLGLAGYAAQLFPYVNTALATDNTLGAAVIYGIHNAVEAQTAYSAFAPNVTGGDRAIAISLTDQSTGAVAARQRTLLMFARQEGGASLWGEEFVQMIKDPGQGADQADGTRARSGFKDSGFGFALGIDSGSPQYGWYGGAFTFYAGDVGELKRDSHTNVQWYLLSGYSVWRGKGLFFNSKIDVGYGHFDGKRKITLTTASTSSSVTTYTREADNKRAGALLSGGVSTGVFLNFGAATLMPTLNLDGLFMRQDPYTEHNPGTTTDGDAFDLKVQPSYANSLRIFLGADLRYDIALWDFTLQPELRAGYRYDFLKDPQKLKAAFAYADITGSYASAGEQFTIQGPDPAQGNFVLGTSLAASTGAWSLGLHFDFVRGSNGATEQVGTLNLLGRI